MPCVAVQFWWELTFISFLTRGSPLWKADVDEYGWRTGLSVEARDPAFLFVDCVMRGYAFAFRTLYKLQHGIGREYRLFKHILSHFVIT